MNHTKVRRGVFETNSSSTHSISIASGAETIDKLHVEEDGVCRIHSGEFGWEVETYSDAATKASYAMVWAKQYSSEENLRLLKKVIQEHTGAKDVVFADYVGEDQDLATGDYDPGYIDHQSQDVAAEAFQSEEKLRAFIFNPRSTLHTDNDNH